MWKVGGAGVRWRRSACDVLRLLLMRAFAAVYQLTSQLTSVAKQVLKPIDALYFRYVSQTSVAGNILRNAVV